MRIPSGDTALKENYWLRRWSGALVVVTTLLTLLSAPARAEVVLACVDCYGSASLYPVIAREEARFAQYGVRWVHIHTEKFLSASQKRDIQATRHLYDVHLDVDMDDPAAVQRAVAFLRNSGVRRVIGGMETGAFQSDIFNHALGLPGNHPDTRELRRAKFPMAQALDDLGIPTLLSRDMDEIERFVASLDSEYVVVKPNRSSGSEGLEFIRRDDLPRLREVLTAMFPLKDKYGSPMNAVVQPAIVGVEYVANTFRDGNRTYLLGAWRYIKVRAPGSGKLVYFVDRPVDPSSKRGQELEALAPLIHHRLGNLVGPGHGELLREAHTGRWYVVEQAARVAGTGVPFVEEKLWGTSHLHANLAFSIGPEAFAAEMARWQGTRSHDAAILNFITIAAGKLTTEGAARITGRQTYLPPFETFRPVAEAPVVETIDLVSSPFVAAFVGGRTAVRRDIADMVAGQLDGSLFDYGENLACPRALERMGMLAPALDDAMSRWYEDSAHTVTSRPAA